MGGLGEERRGETTVGHQWESQEGPAPVTHRKAAERQAEGAEGRQGRGGEQSQRNRPDWPQPSPFQGASERGEAGGCAPGTQQAPKTSCHSLQIKPGCQAPPQRWPRVAGPRTLQLPPVTPPLPRAYLSAPPGSRSESQTAGRLPGPQGRASPPGPRLARDRL